MKFEAWLLQNPPPDFAEFLARHREPAEDGLRLSIPQASWDEWDRAMGEWRAAYRYRDIDER